MKAHGESCRCIRCREIGHKSLKEEIKLKEDDIVFDTNFYNASGGEEVFISLVEKKHDLLVGYLRLREIVNSHRFELLKTPCMIIRELKVLGRELSIGQRTKEGVQHRGFGKELIDEAERICLEEFDKKLLFVLSGVGVKEYYRKHGFKDEGLYLNKTLS
jgi:elongator complex protein 3